MPLGDKNQGNAQFDWHIDFMVKMRKRIQEVFIRHENVEVYYE